MIKYFTFSNNKTELSEAEAGATNLAPKLLKDWGWTDYPFITLFGFGPSNFHRIPSFKNASDIR